MRRGCAVIETMESVHLRDAAYKFDLAGIKKAERGGADISNPDFFLFEGLGTSEFKKWPAGSTNFHYSRERDAEIRKVILYLISRGARLTATLGEIPSVLYRWPARTLLQHMVMIDEPLIVRKMLARNDEENLNLFSEYPYTGDADTSISKRMLARQDNAEKNLGTYVPAPAGYRTWEFLMNRISATENESAAIIRAYLEDHPQARANAELDDSFLDNPPMVYHGVSSSNDATQTIYPM